MQIMNAIAFQVSVKDEKASSDWCSQNPLRLISLRSFSESDLQKVDPDLDLSPEFAFTPSESSVLETHSAPLLVNAELE